MIYHPELEGCPRCGAPLALWNYLAWDKTVQTLEGVYSMASRPGHCTERECEGNQMRIVSGQGQQIALPGSSYGYDVLARIGWLREKRHATYPEIWEALREEGIVISASHVRYLHQQMYLPLLACHERIDWKERLTQTAEAHGGVIIEMDGLMPKAGEAQIWFVRELLSGLVLRSGWLDRCDQTTFEAFLAPVVETGVPVLAVLSDKQSGLVPAVAKMLPDAVHQFCQPHYFRNLADPLAERDTEFNKELRKTIQNEIGVLLRPEASEECPDAAILTTTGALPTPLSTPAQPSTAEAQDDDAGRIVAQVLGRMRQVLTRKGRPPVRLAGTEVYRDLCALQVRTLAMLAHRYDTRLAQVADTLTKILPDFADRYPELHTGATWLDDIKSILDPSLPSNGAEVALSLRTYLDDLLALPDPSSFLLAFRLHLDKVSRSYWPGLFHCYDLAPLPRSNNALESHFRDTRRRLLRTSGQIGLTRRTLLRFGAWELLPRPPTEAARLAALRQVTYSDFRAERLRLRAHLARFPSLSRSPTRVVLQLDALQAAWFTLSPSSTG
jgi:hypothetical protein